ncbi:hypothetical protein DFH08DRAFT_881064, partial [Mycena albidolilacea]
MHNCMLPVELEREIFQLVAFLYPECMPMLVLVAQRVKSWIEPLLYRTISIHVDRTHPRFSRLLLRTVAKLATFNPVALRAHTRHVCFVDFLHDDVIADLLPRCPHVIDIACMCRRVLAGTSLLNAPPLQRLSCILQGLHPIFPWPDPFDGGHPFFSRITHLDICDRQITDWRTWSGLAQIPHLTHLSTSTLMSDSVVQGILKHCKVLEVLVFLYSSQIALEEGKMPLEHVHIDDHRFVRLVVEDRLTDWET